MREAVIVATARTPIGKAHRGAFNNIKSPTLTAHAIRHAVERAGLSSAEVEDVIIGCAQTAGTQGRNLARAAALTAGLDVTAGDSYVQFGRGLVLSMRKVDELGVDTTLFGAKASYEKDPFGVTVIAGLANPARVDEPTGRAPGSRGPR